VSRGGGGQGSTKATHVTLSAEERELAANMGLTEKEWAKNKLALIREGRLGN
jgi:phage I-like protein